MTAKTSTTKPPTAHKTPRKRQPTAPPEMDAPMTAPEPEEGTLPSHPATELLAYQTDLTRISTFMLAREVSARAYPEIGVSDSHHPLSHHQDKAVNLERLHRLNEYHVQQFAYLVKRMSETPEGDGTMLDSTLFLYGTGISDSNTHFHDDLPIALVAGKSTGITGGRYVRYPKGTPLANLHLTLLDTLGVRLESFADSTGRLDALGGRTLSDL